MPWLPVPWRRAALVLVLGCSLQTSAGAMEHLDLPLEHWAYEMLERFEVRASLGRTGLDMRPLRRGQVAQLLRRLQAARQQGDWTPTPIEAAQLRMLRQEFSAELVAQGDSLEILQRAYHHWQGPAWEAQLFVTAGTRAAYGRQDAPVFAQTDAHIAFEPAAAVTLQDRFTAFVPVTLVWRTTDGVLRHSTAPGAGEAEFVFDPRDRFSFSRSVAPYARFVQGPVLVDLGRQRLRWGPGRHNAMLLQDATPPLDLLRLQLDFGWLRFLHLTGQLRPAQLRSDDPPLVERRLAAHRLVLQPHRRLVLAVSETVIYGDRGLDLTYLNPVNVFFVTQANVGDRDNALASLDAKLLLPNLELYGELLVDDLNLRRGLRHFGNKLGVLAGFLWLQPLGGRDWDLDGEWSWASQYTYTHQIPSNRYGHYGLSLGSRAGTDADLWSIGLRRRLSRGWGARLFYELQRHGEGDLATDQEQRQDDAQQYLSGTVESRHQPGVQLWYRGLRNLELDLDVRYVYVVHPGNQADRPAERQIALQASTRLLF